MARPTLLRILLLVMPVFPVIAVLYTHSAPLFCYRDHRDCGRILASENRALAAVAVEPTYITSLVSLGATHPCSGTCTVLGGESLRCRVRHSASYGRAAQACPPLVASGPLIHARGFTPALRGESLRVGGVSVAIMSPCLQPSQSFYDYRSLARAEQAPAQRNNASGCAARSV